ncbi:MAG TPA: DUF3037 domain-containing protein [Pyrinomonadaceae bacterium]|jgi:hypothetical protein|nr:DUF3037 domain-containing protein [Pyrinomonadaceae bacterium]
MSEACTFDYAIIRLVPRVEREEFFNVGVILSCPAFKFLDAKIYLAEQKLAALAPDLHSPRDIQNFLDIFPKVCKGGEEAGFLQFFTQRERFYYLTAQRSTIIQISPVHTGLTEDPGETLEHLFNKIVK